MKPLSPDSPRRIAAARFGAELRKAMLARNVGAKRLSTAIRTGTSAVAVWLAGSNIPRTDTAARLADALDWPKLVDLARAGRSGTCARCGRPFVNEGGAPKRYCTAECREVAGQLRAVSGRATLAQAVGAELDRVHGTNAGLSRKTLGAALAEYARSESRRTTRSRSLETRLGVIQMAVDAMCAGCEPLGVCRDGDCALRPVSPLPLALKPDKVAAEIAPADGAWGEAHRPAMLVTMRAANATRWARPGERERASAAMTERHLSRTPEAQAELTARIAVTYPPERRAETSRRVHAERAALTARRDDS